MKIQTLHLENINALYGDWTIDFNDPIFAEQGIFAILGATGAGKTTILDAICLAIYGATPRLGKITKSDNALMNLNASHCLARVELLIGKKTYGFEFAQRRAKSKTDGALQEPTHTIYEKINGEFSLISEKKSHSEKLAGELLGMDFTQFTRSVMLAQGKFNEFLIAKPEERGEILEKITGTEIYAQIGTKVFELHKQKTQHLEKQKERLGDLKAMSDDELSQLKLQIENDKKIVQTFEKNLNDLQKKIQQKEQYDTNIKAYQNLQTQLKNNQDNLQAFSPKLHQLTLATQHRTLLPLFEKVAFFKNEQQKITDDCQILHHKKSQYQDELTQLSQNIHQKYLTLTPSTQTAQDGLAGLDDLQNALNAHQSILTLDDAWQTPLADHLTTTQEIINQINALNQQEVHIRKLRNDKTLAQQSEQKTAQTLANAQAKLDELGQQLHALLNVSTLDEQTLGTALAHQNAQLHTARTQFDSVRQFVQHHHAFLQLQDEQAQKEQAVFVAKTALDTATLAVSQQKTALDRAESEYRHADDTLRLTDEITRLKDKLTALQDGSPCPLCGSPHHPYKHNPPTPNQKIDELKQQLVQKSQTLDTAKTNHQTSLLALAHTESDHQHACTALTEWQSALSAKQHDLRTLWQSLAPTLPIPNLTSFDALTAPILASLLDDLTAYGKALQEKTQLAQSTHQTFLTAQSEFFHQKQRFDDHTAQMNALEQDKTIANQTYKTLLKELNTPFLTLKQQINFLNSALLADFSILQAGNSFIKDKNSFHQNDEVIKTCKNHFDILQKLIAIYEQTLNKKTLPIFNQHFKALNEYFHHFKNAVAQSKILIKQAINAYQTHKDDIQILSQKFHQYTHQMNEISLSIQSLENKQNALIFEINQHQQTFKNALSPHFTDEAQFLSAQMDEQTFGTFKNEHQTLLTKEHELSIKMAQTQTAIQQLLDIYPDIESWAMAELSADFTEQNTQHQTHLRQLGAKETLYAQGLDEQTKRQILNETIASLGQELDIYHTLNHLIGSADGKKYRNFAQRLTLETLLFEANAILGKMSDRYLLTASDDPKNILGIEVIDRYQADKIRQSKNLSGGESFIISLSLALGLSCMSSQNMQIDSLFLDEGFGTLDEDALDIALSTLGEIQATGKTIGVISHINTLKERISTQIYVQKQAGGKSVLTGAGVVPTKSQKP